MSVAFYEILSICCVFAWLITTMLYTKNCKSPRKEVLKMSLELYTKNNCIQCKMTKNFLMQHDIAFEERNVNENPEYVDYLKNKGFQSVPVLEQDNNPIIRGFRPDLLKKIVAQ